MARNKQVISRALRAERRDSKQRARDAGLSHYWCVIPCDSCNESSRRLLRDDMCLRCYPEMDPRPPAAREKS